MAVIQLINSEIINTWNKERQNSPAAFCDKPMGAKAIMAITVAPNNGHWVWDTICLAASKRVLPRRIPIKMPSVTTMALSTNIPRAIMSAPREMSCSSIPSTFITIKVPRIVSSKIRPINRPERNPINSRSTAITMAMDSIRLIKKPLTVSSTA